MLHSSPVHQLDRRRSEQPSDRSQTTEQQPVEDLLSAILCAYNVKSGIYAHPTLCGNWRFGARGEGSASFHLIARGEGYLHMANSKPVQIETGDLIVLPHDDWHMLSSTERLPNHEPQLQTNGVGSPTTVLCGYFEFESGRRNPILDALPPRILITSSEGGSWLQYIAKLMLAEVETRAPGHRPVLDRLADTLFVMVVRHYVFSSGHEKRGLVAAMADARLRAALDAIHRCPEKNWSLERLAQHAAMSRSVFASHFAAIVGETPIDYLTRWRMVLAERMLRDPRETVPGVMERVGYQTEAAFRKAFKRVHGYGPGRLRRLIRHFSPYTL
jgi:AraC family transcriptional regulator, activator of mtrCDE